MNMWIEELVEKHRDYGLQDDTFSVEQLSNCLLDVRIGHQEPRLMEKIMNWRIHGYVELSL